jgi:hypothetical protein
LLWIIICRTIPSRGEIVETNKVMVGGKGAEISTEDFFLSGALVWTLADTGSVLDIVHLRLCRRFVSDRA